MFKLIKNLKDLYSKFMDVRVIDPKDNFRYYFGISFSLFELN